jgi:hypothetical protein
MATNTALGSGNSVSYSSSYATGISSQQPEPFGEVAKSSAAATTSGLTKRHSIVQPTSTLPPAYSNRGGGGASYGSAGAATTAYGSTGMGTKTHATANNSDLQYLHNPTAVLFLIPPLLALFYSYESPYPLQTCIFLVLAMYAMDLANATEFLSVFLWYAVAILTMVSGGCLLLDAPDDDTSGFTTLNLMLRTTGNCFLFVSLVRRTTLTVVSCWHKPNNVLILILLTHPCFIPFFNTGSFLHFAIRMAVR